MQITDKMVQKLLTLIDQGLTHGAGQFQDDGDFCVQQAVNKATQSGTSDHPSCVTNEITQFGISLNDTFNGSDKERAKILKRFAVAELGSRGVVSGFDFQDKVRELWNKKYPALAIPRRDHPVAPSSGRVKDMADIAVDALIALGSPGTKYLYMCEPGAKLKPEHADALKKEQQRMEELMKRRTQWKQFGAEPSKLKKTTKS